MNENDYSKNILLNDYYTATLENNISKQVSEIVNLAIPYKFPSHAAIPYKFPLFR
jgi:hypothetical protein